jgi:hypothetical protein
MAKGQNFGKLPMGTQVLIVFTGLAVAGGVTWYFIHKHKKEAAEVGARQLAGNVDLTSRGGAVVVSQIAKKDLGSAKASLHNFDPKIPGDMIYEAHGFWNDDEDQVYNAFASLKNRAELTLLSDYFKRLYKRELFEYIQNFLNSAELAKINDIVKKLPTY